MYVTSSVKDLVHGEEALKALLHFPCLISLFNWSSYLTHHTYLNTTISEVTYLHKTQVYKYFPSSPE